MSKIVNVTADSLEETIKSGVTLLDFWAPWCGPCRMIAPVLDQLAEDYEGKATIAKVNTDENQELAKKYDVRSIPYILIFKDGEQVDSLIGTQSKEKFSQSIDAHL